MITKSFGGVVQSRVHNNDELMERLLNVWRYMDHSITDSATYEKRPYLTACACGQMWTLE